MQHVFVELIRFLFPLHALFASNNKNFTLEIEIRKNKLVEYTERKKNEWKYNIFLLYTKKNRNALFRHVLYHENKWMSNPSSWLNWNRVSFFHSMLVFCVISNAFPSAFSALSIKWFADIYTHMCEHFEGKKIEERRKKQLACNLSTESFLLWQSGSNVFNGTRTYKRIRKHKMELLLMDVSSLLERHKIYA